MTGYILSRTVDGDWLRLVIYTSNDDAFTYFVDGGDPNDFPVNTAVTNNGRTLTIGSTDYTIGQYYLWGNVTELTAV